ncbi:MAG: class I SAM-dependent methyltransferase [Acidimicrobiia bacterium]
MPNPDHLDRARWSAEPGSFRDPAGRVFHAGDHVYRTLSEQALGDWRALRSSRLFERATGDGRLVATEEVGADQAGALMPAGEWAGLLRHAPVPFISYPYEWTFAMLRDAALLQLDLLEGALAEDLILKDATPFNVQWRGARPTFIDLGSFERLEPGDLWVGYRQFCRQYLYPLMLRAYKGVPFQAWLRGDPEGPTAADLRALMSTRDLLRPGVLLHVALQARAERRFQGSARDLRRELRAAGFRKELIEANVRRLRKLVAGLHWDRAESAWSEYADQCDHVARDRDQKGRFLDEMLETVKPQVVVDLGANDGHFSQLAARTARQVVAVDADEAVLDRLYGRLASQGVGNVQPLLADLANPSPGTGWDNREHLPLTDRLRPDLVVCYAVVHHLAIGHNVPLGYVVEWLHRFDSPVALEFVAPDDPMARRLTANKRADQVHPDYHEMGLRRALDGLFEVERETTLGEGTRTLMALRPIR